MEKDWVFKMGIIKSINEFIKAKVEEKKEMDAIYNEAYKEQYKKQLVVKAKNDAKDKLNPNKTKTIKPMFKQGLVDDKPSLDDWSIGDEKCHAK